MNTHPELLPGETCIGNWYPPEITALRKKYKFLRVGSVPHNHDGTPKNGCEVKAGLRPVFTATGPPPEPEPPSIWSRNRKA